MVQIAVPQRGRLPEPWRGEGVRKLRLAAERRRVPAHLLDGVEPSVHSRVFRRGARSFRTLSGLFDAFGDVKPSGAQIGGMLGEEESLAVLARMLGRRGLPTDGWSVSVQTFSWRLGLAHFATTGELFQWLERPGRAAPAPVGFAVAPARAALASVPVVVVARPVAVRALPAVPAVPAVRAAPAAKAGAVEVVRAVVSGACTAVCSADGLSFAHVGIESLQEHRAWSYADLVQTAVDELVGFGADGTPCLPATRRALAVALLQGRVVKRRAPAAGRALQALRRACAGRRADRRTVLTVSVVAGVPVVTFAEWSAAGWPAREDLRAVDAAVARHPLGAPVPVPCAVAVKVA